MLIVFIQMMSFLFINFVIFREPPKPPNRETHSKKPYTLFEDPEFLRMMNSYRNRYNSLYSSKNRSRHGRYYHRDW